MYLSGTEGWKKLVIRIFTSEKLNNIMYNTLGKSSDTGKHTSGTHRAICYHPPVKAESIIGFCKGKFAETELSGDSPYHCDTAWE